jgi:hypothetical protein
VDFGAFLALIHNRGNHEGLQTVTREKAFLEPLACMASWKAVRIAWEQDEIARQIRLLQDEAFPAAAKLGIDTRRAERVANVNIELNALLAAKAHGQPARLSKMVIPFLRLGPIGWHLFFRDSRIIQRVIARRRAGLQTSGRVDRQVQGRP